MSDIQKAGEMGKASGAAVRKLFAGAFLLSVGFMMGSVIRADANGDDKPKETKTVTTQMTVEELVFADSDGNARCTLKATPASERHPGLDVFDQDGKLRGRLSWDGLRTTFAIFSQRGQVIQAMPMN